MFTLRIATLALAGALAAPLSAQIVVRDDPSSRRPTSGGSIGDIIFGDSRVDTGATRRSSRVPPGHLPPRGMCRVWIDGVPPGQQPPVTDCATAERNRVANSRVIYGDRETFRGRANGKFKNREREQRCQIRDAVVIDGRVVNVCSDDSTRLDRRGRSARDDREDDDDDDDDRVDKRSKAGKALAKGSRKGGKGHGKN